MPPSNSAAKDLPGTPGGTRTPGLLVRSSPVCRLPASMVSIGYYISTTWSGTVSTGAMGADSDSCQFSCQFQTVAHARIAGD
jgi:hypothetical protein